MSVRELTLLWLTAVSSGRGVVGDEERIVSEATEPLCYILSFDNGNTCGNTVCALVATSDSSESEKHPMLVTAGA